MQNAVNDKPDSQQIDDIITLYSGWKGKLLSQLRAIIKQTDPTVLEEVKWRMHNRPEGLPVWSHNGIVCLAETFKDNIKLVFVKGALMNDLSIHFNSRLNIKINRAIEFHDGDTVDEVVIKKLVLDAVRLNELKAAKK